MAKKTKKTVKKVVAKKAAKPAAKKAAKKVAKKVVAKKVAKKVAKPAKKVAKKATKKAAPKDVLFVASKVKAYIKQNDKMTASETLEALNAQIYAMLDAAIKRTEDNGRKTVKPQDL